MKYNVIYNDLIVLHYTDVCDPPSVEWADAIILLDQIQLLFKIAFRCLIYD